MCEGALVCFVLCFSDARRKWLGGIMYHQIIIESDNVYIYIMYDEMRITWYNYIQLENCMYTGLHCNV